VAIPRTSELDMVQDSFQNEKHESGMLVTSIFVATVVVFEYAPVIAVV